MYCFKKYIKNTTYVFVSRFGMIVLWIQSLPVVLRQNYLTLFENPRNACNNMY
jgi:hypothetical protein